MFIFIFILLLFFNLFFLFSLVVLILCSASNTLVIFVVIAYYCIFNVFNFFLVLTICYGTAQLCVGIVCLFVMIFVFICIIYVMVSGEVITPSLNFSLDGFYINASFVAYIGISLITSSPEILVYFMNTFYCIWFLDSFWWVLTSFDVESQNNLPLLSIVSMNECNAIFLPLAFILVFNGLPMHLVVYELFLC